MFQGHIEKSTSDSQSASFFLVPLHFGRHPFSSTSSLRKIPVGQRRAKALLCRAPRYVGVTEGARRMHCKDVRRRLSIEHGASTRQCARMCCPSSARPPFEIFPPRKRTVFLADCLCGVGYSRLDAGVLIYWCDDYSWFARSLI